MSDRPTRRGATALRVLLGLVAASSLLGGSPASASDHTTTSQRSALAGVQGRAAASGIRVGYRPDGLLPIASPVDFGAPDALATIASGPATFARASVADTGDRLANPDALFALFSGDYPAGTIPPYPYRVTASSGTGEPVAESNPAPGLEARVEADRSGSSARATMPHLAAPAVATAGSIAAHATTTTDGATVTVHARTVVEDFDLLGILVIDSIVTDITITADGTETTVTGGTTITGAKVADQAVTIDASGIHAGEPSGPSDPALAPLFGSGEGSLDEALAEAGIRVTLAGPLVQDGETASQLSAAGLRIDLEVSDRTVPAIGQLADLVPPSDAPLVADVLIAAQARHLTTIQVAQGFASLSARAAPARSSTPASPSGSMVSPGLVGAAPMVGALPTTRGGGSNPTDVGATAVPVGAEAPPATTLAAGVGALAALALIAQPFAGTWLARTAGALLTPGAAGTCAREER